MQQTRCGVIRGRIIAQFISPTHKPAKVPLFNSAIRKRSSDYIRRRRTTWYREVHKPISNFTAKNERIICLHREYARERGGVESERYLTIAMKSTRLLEKL